MTETNKQKPAAEKVRDEANEADMTSSPALNGDAEIDSGQVGKQSLPDGNRFD